MTGKCSKQGNCPIVGHYGTLSSHTKFIPYCDLHVNQVPSKSDSLTVLKSIYKETFKLSAQ